MYRKKLLFITILLPLVLSYGITGELNIQTTTGSKDFSVSLTTNEYAWDYINNKIVLDFSTYPVSYTPSESSAVIKFDAPRSKDSGDKAHLLPWGNFTFTFVFGTYTKTIKIDFRDFGWGSVYVPQDTYIYLNPQNGEVTLLRSSTFILSPSIQYHIWDFDGMSPQQDNFIVPIQLLNKVENSQINIGGYLYHEDKQINSGSNITAVPGNSYNVIEGTKEYTDTQRKYSFSWSNTNIENIIS